MTKRNWITGSWLLASLCATHPAYATEAEFLGKITGASMIALEDGRCQLRLSLVEPRVPDQVRIARLLGDGDLFIARYYWNPETRSGFSEFEVTSMGPDELVLTTRHNMGGVVYMPTVGIHLRSGDSYRTIGLYRNLSVDGVRCQ